MEDFKVSHAELSLQDQINHVAETVKHKWISSYPYTKGNAIEFTTKELSATLTENELFRIHMLYVNLLYRSLTKKDSIIKTEEVLEEVAFWNREGGLCIYLSVVLYSILLNEKIANRHDLRYIQGFTTYESTNPFWKMVSSNTTMLNFHAWLSYKDAVLDFSIGQEAENINLGDTEYLLGVIPSEITMIGFKESHKTVQKYVKRFAKHRYMTEKEWILKHNINSLTCVTEALQHLSDKD